MGRTRKQNRAHLKKFQMAFLNEALLIMLPVVGEWRLTFFRAMATFSDYSAATLEAIAAVCLCNEIFLSISLALTKTLVFYLSAMLKLNALLRLMLAEVLLSQELDQCSSCTTSPSSQTSRLNSRGGGRCTRWWKLALHVLPVFCRLSCCVCTNVLALLHLVPSALLTLSRDFRPSICTILTMCGSIRPLLSTS